MTRRAERIVAAAPRERRRSATPRGLPWAGTFHAVANRLLRAARGARSGSTRRSRVLDRGDAADLIDLAAPRARALDARPKRFPRKATCLAIYSQRGQHAASRCGDAGRALPVVRRVGGGAHARCSAPTSSASRRSSVLDYDDLLLYWHALMAEPALAARVGARFDHVLVDEYQDTNTLQAEILRALKPDGAGLTVVGDDAQSIYSFRAATVRQHPRLPGAVRAAGAVVTLERELPLDAADPRRRQRGDRPRARALSRKNLFARRGARRAAAAGHGRRRARRRPTTSSTQVLERARGRRRAASARRCCSAPRTTATRSRSSSARRNIPFVKYGGLKFLEAAHVKDVLALLRWAENPRDRIAAFRVLQLLPGIGPAQRRRAAAPSSAGAAARSAALGAFAPPAAARADWPALVDAARARSRGPAAAWPGQLERVRDWYQPHLERLLRRTPQVRAGDLDAAGAASPRGYATRERFLSELTLDPPQATRRRGRPAAPRRGLPDPVDDPLGQGPGVGRGLRAQRRRRLLPVGPRDRRAAARSRRSAACSTSR